MKTYLFQVVVEPDGDEWFAYSPALRSLGGTASGRSREDALRNIREVVGMVIDSMREHGDPIPEGPGDQVRVFEERVAVMV